MTSSPAVPNTLDSLKELVELRFGNLPPRVQVAARYLMDHPNAAAMETIKTLSSAATVQPSVLVRLAKTLGYTGFSEMQAVFRTELLAQTQSYGERMRARRKGKARTGLPGAAPPSPGDMLRLLCEGSIDSLTGLRDAFDESALLEAAGMLAGARTIQVIGLRRAWPVATYLAYLLSRSQRNVRVLGGMGGMLSDEARAMHQGDVLVAISFHPFHVDTVAAVAGAHERGAAVIAITDSTLSPIARNASVVLEVRDADAAGFRTVAASMALCHALTVSMVIAETQPVRRRRPAANA